MTVYVCNERQTKNTKTFIKIHIVLTFAIVCNSIKPMQSHAEFICSFVVFLTLFCFSFFWQFCFFLHFHCFSDTICLFPILYIFVFSVHFIRLAVCVFVFVTHSIHIIYRVVFCSRSFRFQLFKLTLETQSRQPTLWTLLVYLVNEDSSCLPFVTHER